MKVLSTSRNMLTTLRIALNEQTLAIEHVPKDFEGRDVLIKLTATDGRNVIKEYRDKGRNLFATLHNLPDGNYNLDIYFCWGERYWSFFSTPSPVIRKQGCNCDFLSSLVAIHNSLCLNSIPFDRKFLKEQLNATYLYQSDNEQIRHCARGIAESCITQFDMMKAVHDFVASYVSYDLDALHSGDYRIADNSALGTFQAKKGVCQNYTNLSFALLRALGIPAMAQRCYSLGSEADGDWEDARNRNAMESNHVFTLAFVDGAWRAMDITWDSCQEYSNGKFHRKDGLGNTHRFFDVSIPMLSLTHKIICKN